MEAWHRAPAHRGGLGTLLPAARMFSGVWFFLPAIICGEFSVITLPWLPTLGIHSALAAATSVSLIVAVPMLMLLLREILYPVCWEHVRLQRVMSVVAAVAHLVVAGSPLALTWATWQRERYLTDLVTGLVIGGLAIHLFRAMFFQALYFKRIVCHH